MPMTPEEAKKWAFKNSRYLSLGDGDFFTAVLRDSKPIPSRFDADKETIRYTFEFEDGSKKFWENGSGAYLETLSGLYNKKVCILRTGVGNSTKYTITQELD